MRAVVQRVSRARVTVGGEEISAIEHGLLVLVGVAEGDGSAEAAALVDKLVGLRIFADAEDRMNLDVATVGGAVLVVSQFTLLGETRRGRRPSFVAAARPEVAQPLIADLEARLRATGLGVSSGRFGAFMEVESVNDGPVTILLEVRNGRVV